MELRGDDKVVCNFDLLPQLSLLAPETLLLSPRALITKPATSAVNLGILWIQSPGGHGQQPGKRVDHGSME